MTMILSKLLKENSGKKKFLSLFEDIYQISPMRTGSLRS